MILVSIATPEANLRNLRGALFSPFPSPSASNVTAELLSRAPSPSFLHGSGKHESHPSSFVAPGIELLRFDCQSDICLKRKGKSLSYLDERTCSIAWHVNKKWKNKNKNLFLFLNKKKSLNKTQQKKTQQKKTAKSL